MEDEEPSGLNMLEDSDSLLKPDDPDYRHYKLTTNQIETFDYCIKNAPPIYGQFLRAVIEGNISGLKELVI
jgi:hypothetical protein